MRRCGRVTKCDADPRSCAALIALSASGGWRSFFLGIRWGLGHTTGLVVIAAIFFALNGQFDLAEVGHYGDLAVGLFSASFSILIGVVWLWYLLQGKEIDLSGVPLFG